MSLNIYLQVFFFFCALTNIIVSAMLILGGAAVMTALTGMSTYAVSPSPIPRLYSNTFLTQQHT